MLKEVGGLWQGESTEIIPLDFPKVFGKVPQQRLLKEGSSLGTGGEILTGEIVC